MAATNDITGDALKTRAATQAYREGWARTFGKKDESGWHDIGGCPGCQVDRPEAIKTGEGDSSEAVK